MAKNKKNNSENLDDIKDTENISSNEVTVETSTNEEKVVETPEKSKKTKEKQLKPLSSQALKWKTYLRQMNWTAKVYLSRFPEHKYKEFIEELIPYEESNKNN